MVDVGTHHEVDGVTTQFGRMDWWVPRGGDFCRVHHPPRDCAFCGSVEMGVHARGGAPGHEYALEFVLFAHYDSFAHRVDEAGNEEMVRDVMTGDDSRDAQRPLRATK